MKLHRNAKTTPVTRALLLERIRRQGWRVGTAAEAQGISRRTAHKWLRRSLTDLEDRSSRPLRHPRRTRALRPWLRYYNGQRPHAELGLSTTCFPFFEGGPVNNVFRNHS